MNEQDTSSGPERAGEKELLDVVAVGKLLKCSPRHVYRLCEMGLMPRPMKLGRLNRWSKTAILDRIDAGCTDCRKGADDE